MIFLWIHWRFHFFKLHQVQFIPIVCVYFAHTLYMYDPSCLFYAGRFGKIHILVDRIISLLGKWNTFSGKHNWCSFFKGYTDQNMVILHSSYLSKYHDAVLPLKKRLILGRNAQQMYKRKNNSNIYCIQKHCSPKCILGRKGQEK